MFIGINVCGSLFLVNYLGTHELCLWVFIFAIERWSRISPNKSLANINDLQ